MGSRTTRDLRTSSSASASEGPALQLRSNTQLLAAITASDRGGIDAASPPTATHLLRRCRASSAASDRDIHGSPLVEFDPAGSSERSLALVDPLHEAARVLLRRPQPAQKDGLPVCQMRNGLTHRKPVRTRWLVQSGLGKLLEQAGDHEGTKLDHWQQVRIHGGCNLPP